jgi:hypothetical protein
MKNAVERPVTEWANKIDDDENKVIKDVANSLKM